MILKIIQILNKFSKKIMFKATELIGISNAIERYSIKVKAIIRKV